MARNENYNEYDTEPIAYCANCFSLKIKHDDSIDMDYCNECGCSNINEAPVEVWEALYEKKYGKKFIIKGKDPKKNPVFKLTIPKLMDKFSHLSNWRTIIYNMYPRFPGGFGKADSIVLFFDKLSKDNKLDDLRLTMMKYIKG